LNYVSIDCETTGVHPSCNILTVAFVVFNEKGRTLKELEVKILPPDGIFSVDPRALEVNKIDLAQHLLEAEPLDKVQNKIRSFLQQTTSSVDPSWDGVGDIRPWIRRTRLVPVGSQVNGDIRWIKDKVLPDLSTYVSHKIQDTVCIAEFLKEVGILQVEKTGLESLANHFGVVYTPHIAIEDCRAAMKVFLSMVYTVKSELRGSYGKRP
jgi:DNA polymerase III epsilon subunit-like protein